MAEMITMFRANDGKVFDCLEEALRYEKDLRAVKLLRESLWGVDEEEAWVLFRDIKNNRELFSHLFTAANSNSNGEEDVIS